MEKPRNAVLNEYLELWNTIVSQTDEYLPHVIENGLATTREKIGVDTIDLVVSKHEELQRLRQELQEADREYNELMAQMKTKYTDPSTNSITIPEPEDRATRIVDFLFGVVTSLKRDFSRAPELEYIMQQIYLFAAKNAK